MHYYGKSRDAALVPNPVYDGRSRGYTQASLVHREQGSVHTGLTLNRLDAGGWIAPHVHSFEEGFYVLRGEPVVTIDGASYQLRPGDYAALKVGTPHAWHAAASGPVEWLQVAAPQPNPPGAERDTFFLKDGRAAAAGAPFDPADPAAAAALLGHFDAGQIPPPAERQSAAPGLEGVFLKWLVDEAFGARHHRFLFIEYQPGVSLGLHDHTFEESYFILSGEVQATLDGRTYHAVAGDVLWTGVGCVHAFANVGTEPVRWLETFAPQPPKENVFRFVAEWDARGRALER